MATTSDKPSSKSRAWFCTTGLPSDVVIEVGAMSFHLHKFPLMSKSNRLNELITEKEKRITREENEEEQEIEEDSELHITLTEFPGGAETFEAAAKFCYGVKVDFNSSNAIPLRCAGELLGMTELISDDNLISRSETFLRESVLTNVNESIKALKSCEELLPLADELGLVEPCVESIAVRAAGNLTSLFSWPVKESKSKLGNGIVVRRKSSGRKSSSSSMIAEASWLDDLSMLSLPMYKRVIDAMKKLDVNSRTIETCLITYAKKSIPGLSRSGRKHSSSASESEQREILETAITNLPVEKTSSLTSTATASFMFGLLRTANILRVSDESKILLEKKIASLLDKSTLDELLVPSYSYLVDTLYDIDCVERIVTYFIEDLRQVESVQQQLQTTTNDEEQHDHDEELEDSVHSRRGKKSPAPQSERTNRLMLVGKLIDGYLAEIASDANLKPDKFCKLALSLPADSRLFEDGLYRAVDIYLKAHPGLGEDEKERVCSVMDCGKLTPEACTHAAQNERLPLRAVVQVLFFEQLQLRHAIADTILINSHHGHQQSERVVQNGAETMETDLLQQQISGGGVWRNAARENQVLRLDMDSMTSRVQGLERECSSMKKTLAKIEPSGRRREVNCRNNESKGSLGKRFGCKFKTQVCDSHERTVVEPRRSRSTLQPATPDEEQSKEDPINSVGRVAAVSLEAAAKHYSSQQVAVEVLNLPISRISVLVEAIRRGLASFRSIQRHNGNYSLQCSLKGWSSIASLLDSQL